MTTEDLAHWLLPSGLRRVLCAVGTELLHIALINVRHISAPSCPVMSCRYMSGVHDCDRTLKRCAFVCCHS
jgi:hypothetical protein